MILKELLKRAQAEDFVENLTLEAFALGEAERDSFTVYGAADD